MQVLLLTCPPPVTSSPCGTKPPVHSRMDSPLSGGASAAARVATVRRARHVLVDRRLVWWGDLEKVLLGIMVPVRVLDVGGNVVHQHDTNATG